MLPIVEKHYRSTLIGQATDMSSELDALAYRSTQRRLRSLEFCDSCSTAEVRQFSQEVDRLFRNLSPGMTHEEEKAVHFLASQSMPALGTCYEVIRQELNSINKTIFRGLIQETMEFWLDAPGYLTESAADTQLIGALCAAILAVAIFLGYNGSCDCPNCLLSESKKASEATLNADSKPKKQCSAPIGIQIRDKESQSHRQGTTDSVREAMRKAGVEIKYYAGTEQLRTNIRIVNQAIGNSQSAEDSAMHPRKTTNKAKQVRCSGCKLNLPCWHIPPQELELVCMCLFLAIQGDSVILESNLQQIDISVQADLLFTVHVDCEVVEGDIQGTIMRTAHEVKSWD